MAPQVKLTYFDLKALGEPIRYLLNYGGVNFEDVRLSFEEWPAFKPTTPFGQMPLYEENGKVANQSLAICRYLAKKVKLVGKTEWEDLEIDAIVDTVSDLRLKLATYFFEANPEHKESLKEGLFKETIPFYLERLEAIAKKNNGHLALSRLTWADLFFAAISDLMNYVSGKDLLEDRPNLKAVKASVESLPAIKKWIASRPKTNF